MNQPDRKVPPGFYTQTTLRVARGLLGLHLVFVEHGVKRIGRIVETEAYQGPQDQAAHSSRGLTPRNAVMFGPAGHAYVYLIYGMWHCVNIVTRSEGVPHAVLIRAVEPVANLHNNTHGPGLLCRAYGINRTHNGVNLQSNQLWLEYPDTPQRTHIVADTRIGVDYAGIWASKPWRFYDADSAHVSTLRTAQRKRMRVHDQA